LNLTFFLSSILFSQFSISETEAVEVEEEVEEPVPKQVTKDQSVKLREEIEEIMCKIFIKSRD
jgi:hypothetical protein